MKTLSKTTQKIKTYGLALGIAASSLLFFNKAAQAQPLPAPVQSEVVPDTRVSSGGITLVKRFFTIDGQKAQTTIRSKTTMDDRPARVDSVYFARETPYDPALNGQNKICFDDPNSTRTQVFAFHPNSQTSVTLKAVVDSAKIQEITIEQGQPLKAKFCDGTDTTYSAVFGYVSEVRKEGGVTIYNVGMGHAFKPGAELPIGDTLKLFWGQHSIVYGFADPNAQVKVSYVGKATVNGTAIDRPILHAVPQVDIASPKKDYIVASLAGKPEVTDAYFDVDPANQKKTIYTLLKGQSQYVTNSPWVLMQNPADTTWFANIGLINDKDGVTKKVAYGPIRAVDASQFIYEFYTAAINPATGTIGPLSIENVDVQTNVLKVVSTTQTGLATLQDTVRRNVISSEGNTFAAYTVARDSLNQYSWLLNAYETVKKADTATSVVEEVVSAQGMSLSPNPTNGRVDIRLAQPSIAPVKLYVSDIFGRIVAEGTVPAGQTEAQLDMVALPAGTYMVGTERGKGQKVIKTQ